MPLSVSARDLEKEETGNRLHIKKANYYIPEKEKETELLSLVAVPLRLGGLNLVGKVGFCNCKRYENVIAVPRYLGGDLEFEKQSCYLALRSEVDHRTWIRIICAF